MHVGEAGLKEDEMHKYITLVYDPQHPLKGPGRGIMHYLKQPLSIPGRMWLSLRLQWLEVRQENDSRHIKKSFKYPVWVWIAILTTAHFLIFAYVEQLCLHHNYSSCIETFTEVLDKFKTKNDVIDPNDY